MSELKSRFVKGTLWTLIEKFSVQIAQFFVAMVLARLLTPSDYGTISLLSVFLALAGVFADCGIGSALIQKKNATELDFNSVFYISILVSALLYLILFFSAPAIASFYGVSELKPIMRVLALSLMFNAVNSVQNAEISRNLLFNLSFKISLICTFMSAVTGVSLAYLGYGSWALVWSSMVSAVSGVVSKWFIVGWRPKLMFSFGSLGRLISFGWKMTVSSLVASINDNIYGLIVGKFYSRADLAYTNKGHHLPQLMMDVTQGTLIRSAQPTLSQMQDETERLRENTRRMVRCSAFVMFPALIGCAVCSRNLMLLMFGSQWLPAVPFAVLACFKFVLWPLALVQQTLFALGRSDVLLKLQIARSILSISILLSTIWVSPLFYVAAEALLGSPLKVVINALPSKKLFGYSLWMQIKDVLPIAGITAAMAVIVLGLDILGRRFILCGDSVGMLFSRFGLQIVSGAIVFGVFSYLFKIREMAEYARMFGGIVGRKAKWAAPLIAKILHRVEG